MKIILSLFLYFVNFILLFYNLRGITFDCYDGLASIGIKIVFVTPAFSE